MKEIKLYKKLGKFAENKDIARDIRLKEIMPFLEKGEKVVLDFKGINAATQSCIHALISEIIRKKGIDVLNKVFFKNCENTVKKIINLVVDYMQDQDYYEHKKD